MALPEEGDRAKTRIDGQAGDHRPEGKDALPGELGDEQRGGTGGDKADDGRKKGRKVDISIAEEYYSERGIEMMKTTKRFYQKRVRMLEKALFKQS